MLTQKRRQTQKNLTHTKKQSIQALKKFIKISLCHITASRQLFPITAYKQRKFVGLDNVMIFKKKEKQQHDDAQQFHQWIESVSLSFLSFFFSLFRFKQVILQKHI